jgi:serine/threonine protein kinase
MANHDNVHGSLKAGDVLAGKYRVERILGAGGMGVVVAAHHLQLDEKVALKFLLPEALGSDQAVARFLQEARAAAKVKSEHVARVIDVGQLENGSPFMVMEYLDGTDLAGWLKQRGALRVEQATDFVLQACEALADAHSLGIVHRDLKPANLFCIQRTDGRLSIKVLDFGISKVTTPGAAGHDMTRTSTLMGSPLYMSPEQMKQAKGVDARTDIWSLGIILFELVTGRPPFTAEAVTELAIKVATEPAPSLREFRHDAPAGLEQVVEICLQKDRARRFQSVGDLAIALRDFGSKDGRISVERVLGTLRTAGVTTSVLPPEPALPPPTTSAPALPATIRATGATWGRTASATSSGTKTVVGIVLVALVGVLAVAVGILWSRKPSLVAGEPRGAATQVVTAALPGAAPPPVQAPVAPSVPGAQAPATMASAVPIVIPAALPSPGPVVSSAPPATATAAATARAGGRPPPPPVTHAGHPQPPATSTPSAAAQAPTPSAKPNCNPPYVIDAAGDRQYKPECL